MKDPNKLFVTPATSFRDVLAIINAAGQGIALVVDEARHLIGVITDGDARRAVLAGVPLTASTEQLLQRKPQSSGPITAPAATPIHELVTLVQRTGVSHVPLVNDESQVVGFVGLDDLLAEEDLALQAVVMAGGLGRRLQPLTENTPKPMLKVGDRPLMEHIIETLSQAGIRQVNIATHYLSEQITEHFGDGGRFGVEVNYMPEKRLLGTVGAVGLLPENGTPTLVINGDILTTVDFRAMLSFHREHHADLTVAVRHHEVQVPYGVVESDGVNLTGISEKPKHRHLVNAGIYLMEPHVRQYIPSGERCDMTDLIELLLGARRTVICFPVWEYWRDIGHSSDYAQAVDDVRNGRLSP